MEYLNNHRIFPIFIFKFTIDYEFFLMNKHLERTYFLYQKLNPFQVLKNSFIDIFV